MRPRRLAIAAAFLAAAALLVVAAGSSAVGPYPPLGGCGVFPRPDASVPPTARSLPDQRAWNQDVSRAPLAPNSGRIIDYINAHGGDFLHPDFGSPRGYGFPYKVVGQAALAVPVHFTLYGDESDHGTYRVPLAAPVEGGATSGGDRHVLAYDRSRCLLYELGRAFPRRDLGRWDATVGVIWDLRSAAPAHRELDLRGRRRAADLPRARPLRRGPGRPHRPRHPGDLRRHQGRVDPSGLALRRLDVERPRAADGHAAAPRRRVRPLRL